MEDGTTAGSPLSDAIVERLREAMALMLWDLDAVRVRPEDPFRLASGASSPIYVNCRRVVSDPAAMQLFAAAGRLICERREVELDAIAGGETAGIPFAAYLASAWGRPMIYVRKKPKGYGTTSQIEGFLPPGSRVLLVEDLITDGGSKAVFLDAIAAAGSRVTDGLVLFDRQQGGDALLAERGVRLHAVADRATAMRVGLETGRLTASARDTVEEYFRDPAAWSERVEGGGEGEIR